MPQHPLTPVQNPFMFLLDPEVVLAAVRGSERLERLSRRICHPLDRPAPVKEEAAIVKPGITILGSGLTDGH